MRSEKLRDKSPSSPWGDRRIGRAVAMLFAKEGRDEAVTNFKEDKDARGTKVARGKCLLACSVLHRAQRRWISFCIKVVGPAFSFRCVVDPTTKLASFSAWQRTNPSPTR